MSTDFDHTMVFLSYLGNYCLTFHAHWSFNFSYSQVLKTSYYEDWTKMLSAFFLVVLSDLVGWANIQCLHLIRRLMLKISCLFLQSYTSFHFSIWSMEYNLTFTPKSFIRSTSQDTTSYGNRNCGISEELWSFIKRKWAHKRHKVHYW